VGPALTWLGLLLALAGLILQFSLTIPAALDAGRSLPGALVFFFSFFTILTNIAVVLTYVAAILDGRRLAFFARPSVRAGVAVAIAVVSIVYATILAPLWSPQGLFLIADATLHYVTPVLYAVWWFLVGRDGSTRLANLPLWLAYPLAYLAFALVRSPIAGEVPYPFLDYMTNGWASVLVASAMMFALFVVLGVVAVMLDRLPAPHRPILPNARTP